MKKLVLLSIIILSSLGLNAQNDFDATGIVEHFTNTKCGICGANNPAFYTKLEQQDNFIHVAYHPKYPYNSCKFYEANKTGNMVKTDLYNISGTPTGVFNGSIKKSIRNVIQSDFMDYHEAKSSVSIEIVDAGTDEVQIAIINNDFDKDNTQFKLFAMMVEDPVNYSAPNGEKVHHNVFRKWLTSQDGLDLGQKDESVTLTLDYSNVEVPDNAKVIAYVQDMISQKIYNATESSSLTSTIELLTGVKVFPSQVKSHITIQTEVSADLVMYSISGEKLYQKTIPAGETIVDMETLQAGLYLINLTDRKGRTMTEKIIKQ